MKNIIVHSTTDSRSAAIRGLLVCVTAALAPIVSYAQSSSVSDKGFFAGASAGVYFESSEGKSGHGPAGSGSIGYRFNGHWAVQAEIGATGKVYCYQTVATALPGGGFNYTYLDVPKDHPPAGSTCHDDPILSIDAVLRLTAGPTRPYFMLGYGAGLHLGLGVEVPLGRRFAVVPGIDFTAGPEFGAARPRVALLVRF